MFQENMFQGQSVLITGGGSGLGLAMAERLAELGARVALCGRDSAKLERAAEKLSSTFGADVFTKAADVRDASAVTDLFDALDDHWGGVELLINNAAGNFYCASEDLSSNAFQTVVEIVLVGTFHCTQQFGKRLIDRKQPGSVLNIVTTYTESGSAFVLPSACAKAGVAALTTTLAYEWAEYGIRVNAIAPGPIPTEGAWKRLIPGADFEELYRKRLPMGRFGRPDELANLAAFLLSEGAEYINGAVVPIDGAERLQGGEFNFLAQLMPRSKLKELFHQMKPSK